MIDTLGLESPPILECLAVAIEAELVTREAVDNATGEQMYCFTSGTLEGSFDNRIRVSVEREQWVSQRNLRTLKTETWKEACEPFLRVEGSVHKALLGHNLFGGPLHPGQAARWFIQAISDGLGLPLPFWKDWTVNRIDWAEVYDLGSFEGPRAFIGSMALMTYPRRKALRYGAECILFPGTTTAEKLYHKGPEFQKHDSRRLVGVIGKEETAKLQIYANNLLRTETSIKSKKLQADYGKKPGVQDITQEYLEAVHDKGTGRILQEGKSSMETVRTARAVNERLHQHYRSSTAILLYSTWVQFSTLGETESRKMMARRTFYRQRKQLRECGVSWTGTDVIMQENAIPLGFSLARSDPRRLTGQAPEVTKQLLAVV